MNRISYILFFVFSLGFAQSEKKFSLLYENDEFGLTSEHQTKLDSLKGILNKSDYDVHIKGYTNSIGGSEYNQELSEKRAELVKLELNEFTILTTKGFGELKGPSANNRRVDVLIHLKTEHVVVPGEIREEPVIFQKVLKGLPLLQPKKGDKAVLDGIMFYPGRDVVRNDSKQALEELLAFLQKNPKIRFKLIGHVCCGDRNNPGRDAQNIRTGKRNLSEARAHVIHNYLVKQGIDKRRIQYIGMAYRYPTGQGDEFDKRVEIEITSVD